VTYTQQTLIILWIALAVVIVSGGLWFGVVSPRLDSEDATYPVVLFWVAFVMFELAFPLVVLATSAWLGIKLGGRDVSTPDPDWLVLPSFFAIGWAVTGVIMRVGAFSPLRKQVGLLVAIAAIAIPVTTVLNYFFSPVLPPGKSL
jgi:hypothetical protein